MANKSVLAAVQAKLSELRRDLRFAAIDPGVSDEHFLELRANFQRAEEEFRKMSQKKGLLGFLGL
jgi:hypothetical protein